MRKVVNPAHLFGGFTTTFPLVQYHHMIVPPKKEREADRDSCTYPTKTFLPFSLSLAFALLYPRKFVTGDR